MRKPITFFLFVTSIINTSSALAAMNHPYDAPPAWAMAGNNQAVVSSMTATKDQNGSGFCYGFAATTLLENFLCKERALRNCNQIMLSSLHVSSFRDEGTILEDGGSTGSLLTKIKRQNSPIVREACAPFPKYKDFLTNIKAAGYKDAEDFEARYNYTKSNPGCIECMNAVERAMPHLNQTMIKELMSKFRYKEFLARAVISDDCMLNQSERIPPFEVRTRYQTDFRNTDEIYNQVEKLVMNQIPVQINIQVDEDAPPSYHAITIDGIKQVCGSQEQGCVRMFKIKNSYGKNWENANNGGWVVADNLIDHFKAHSGLTMNWIEKPGQVLRNLALKRETLQYDRDAVEVKPRPSLPGATNYKPSARELGDSSITWKCNDGVNPIMFTNTYKGTHCQPM